MSIRGGSWPAEWKRSVLKNLIGSYYALGIQILKVRKARVLWITENFQGSEGRTWTPIMIIMGSQGQVRCFYGKWKKFKQCLKDVLNVSIDYLNVVFIWPNRVGNEVASPQFAFMIFGVEFEIDGSFWGKRDLWIWKCSRSDNWYLWLTTLAFILISGIGCARLGLTIKVF